MTKNDQSVVEMLQQGDVLIKKIEKIPEQATSVEFSKNGSNVLAEGEATGHFHGVDESTTVLMEHEGVKYLRVEQDTEVTHQEHDKFSIPAGDYIIDIVQEYDHFEEEVRNVAD